MSIAREIPTTPDPDQPEACPHCALGRRVERRLAMLDQLAELALSAAVAAERKIVEQAERDRAAAPDPTGARDQAAKNLQLDFARAAQAVRQTLALQEKIEQDFRALTDRQAAEAAARRAAAAQRRAAAARHSAAERQAHIEQRKVRVKQDIGQVIRAKATPGTLETLLAHLSIQLRPERLDSDFGDIPLREIFLRICRNLGLPAEWSRQWDEEPEAEGSAPGDVPAPIHATAPVKTAEPAQAAGPGEAKASPQRRQNVPPPLPLAVPGKPSVEPAATALALCLAAPGTGPP
jgi:multidrug efflux pump subunit AcrA (membrane-fusion protein)